MLAQRDTFIKEITDQAKKDRNIFFVSADFGAPALDQFRKKLPKQFIHAGISEQNMIAVAAGLALSGKKVFVYAMAPFVSLRCLEQHKTITALMNLPVTTIVAGIGIGYADAGPTHYVTEDLACLRSLIKSKIYTVSDPKISSYIAKKLCKNPEFCFVRLERLAPEPIYKNLKVQDVNKGFIMIKKKLKIKKLIVSHGYQFIRLKKYFEKNNDLFNHYHLIDLINTKPIPKILKKIFNSYSEILTIDEQTEQGSLGSALLEFLNNGETKTKIKCYNLNENFIFENGGRERLLNSNGLNLSNILKI